MDRYNVTLGQTVLYRSYGTPGGEYKSDLRAAIVTKVNPAEFGAAPSVALCVLNPTGIFFNDNITYGNGPGQYIFLDDAN